MKLRQLGILSILLVSAVWVWAQEAPFEPNKPQPIETPSFLNLDGDWEILPNAVSYEEIQTGKYDKNWGIVQVPGLWFEAKFPKTLKMNWAGEPDFAKSTAELPKSLTTPYTWYRKRFYLSPDLKPFNGRIILSGVKWNAEVWMNGHLLGTHSGGYAPFEFDITKEFRAGRENEVLIKLGGWRSIPVNVNGLPKMTVGSTQPWQRRTGGITESVNLRFYRRLAINNIHCTPNAKEKMVNVRVTIRNADKVRPDDKVDVFITQAGSMVPISEVSMEIDVDSTSNLAGCEVLLNVPEAKLWWPWRPYLYNVVVMAKDKAGTPLDIQPATFGLRDMQIKDGHFYLNDQRIQLRGANMYRDNDLVLGAEMGADTTFLKKYFYELPKEGNIMALRTNNAPLPQSWLDFCDKTGIMVISEFPITHYSNQWDDTTFGLFAIQEFKELMPHLWNHPSIVLWSVSNQSWNNDKRMTETQYIVPLVKNIDPTRPVMRAGDESEDVLDFHSYDGVAVGTMDDFRKKVETASKLRPNKPRLCTDYLDIESDDNGLWKEEGRIQFNFSKKATAEEMQIKHAELAAEQTEILRLYQLDGIFASWYPNWFGMNEWSKNFKNAKLPQKKLTYYAMKNALAPVAVSVDMKNTKFKTGQSISVPVRVINDTPGDVPVKVELYLFRENPKYAVTKVSDLAKTKLFYDISSSTVATFSILSGNVVVPLEKVLPGSYYITALLTLSDTKQQVLSQRRIDVLKREE